LLLHKLHKLYISELHLALHDPNVSLIDIKHTNNDLQDLLVKRTGNPISCRN